MCFELSEKSQPKGTYQLVTITLSVLLFLTYLLVNFVFPYAINLIQAQWLMELPLIPSFFSVLQMKL